MQHLDVNIRRKNNEVLLTVVRAKAWIRIDGYPDIC